MGPIRFRPRPSSVVSAFLAHLLLLPGAAGAADLSPSAQADLRRAYAAAALSTSEEPAVRAERRTREPSPGFMLGAALGAWTAAAAQLAFDLNNPAAAGPPHVSQTGHNDDALAQDCADETTAFTRLDSRAQALGLTPAAVTAAAGAPAMQAAAWQTRRMGPAPACR
jgi:hypothetical protein